jgi:hypothetical protein
VNLVKVLELVVGGHELDRTLRQVASLRHLPLRLGLDRPRTGQPHGLLEAGVGVGDHGPARRPGRQRWAVSLVRAHNLRPWFFATRENSWHSAYRRRIAKQATKPVSPPDGERPRPPVSHRPAGGQGLK